MTVAHGGDLLENITEVPGLPEFNPMSLLHGTEDVFIQKPLEPGTKYIVTDKFKDFQDKGSGALMIVDSEIREKDSGEL